MKYRIHGLTIGPSSMILLFAIIAAAIALSPLTASKSYAQTETSPSLPAPTLTASQSGTNQVVLSWTPVAGAVRYELRTWWDGAAGWHPIDNGSLTGTYFTHIGLTPGRQYFYVVAAMDANASWGSWSEQVSVTVTNQLAAPTLSASEAVTTTVDLSWTAVSAAVRYELRAWWKGAEDWQTVDDGSLTGTSFTDTDLAPGQTYLYIVAAVDSGNQRGRWSEQVTVTIPESDDQSSALTAHALAAPTLNAVGGAETITLRWDGVANADSYQLIFWDSASEDWRNIGGVLNGTSFTHIGLTDGTAHHYHLRAVGPASAFGAWSELATASAGAPTSTLISATPATTARGALTALYEATDGENWVENENWLSDESLSDWYGVVTDSSGQVVELDLSGNGLKGSIPPLNALTELRTLDLGQNALSGTIPDLSTLTKLVSLDLGFNDLSGPIPNLSNLIELTNLDLGANQLSGSIPDLSSLVELRTVNLEGNEMTGTIPDLSALSGLVHLNLGFNQLTGNIQNAVNLPSLRTLVLSGNRLDGEIPDLSSLSQLRRLDLHSNLLTGEIPSLSALARLTWLDLHFNLLAGPIPDLGSLTFLSRLSLHSNQLTGPVLDLNALTELTWLTLGGNKLSGPLPDLGVLAKLRWLDLSYNQLCIPAGLDLTVLPEFMTKHLDSLELGACSEDELSAQPGAPQELTATVSDGQVSLGWEAAANAASYDLWVWDSIDRQWQEVGGALTESEYTHQDLQDDRNYYYQVRARDAAGNPGPWTQRVHAVLEAGEFPSPPSSLGLHVFYQKHLEIEGVTVTAPSEVADEKMVQARAIISGMLSSKTDLIGGLDTSLLRVAIVKQSENGDQLIQMPEFSLIQEDTDGLTSWDQDQWLAGVVEDDAQCDLFIREGARLILHGISAQDGGDEFNAQLESLHAAAREAGLWQSLLAMESAEDYWAETVRFWFQGTLPESLAANDLVLNDYDPEVAKLIEEVFGEASVPSFCKP